MSERTQSREHRCNVNRCHRCPDMDGMIMPGCMGTAARGNGPYDLSACTCQRRVQPVERTHGYRSRGC